MLSNTNNLIQSSVVDLAVTMSAYSVPTWSFIELKWDNNLNGLLTIPDISTNCNDANYNCYYFPRINLLQGHKKTATFTSSFVLGATQLSNDYVTTFGFKWAKVLRSNNIQTLANPYTLYTDAPASKTLNFLTSHISPSVTKL